MRPTNVWWGVNVALFQDNKDTFVMKGFDDYLDTFCAWRLRIAILQPCVQTDLPCPLAPPPFSVGRVGLPVVPRRGVIH